MGTDHIQMLAIVGLEPSAIYYRCNNYVFFQSVLLRFCLSMTSLAFASKMFDNLGISWNQGNCLVFTSQLSV